MKKRSLTRTAKYPNPAGCLCFQKLRERYMEPVILSTKKRREYESMSNYFECLSDKTDWISNEQYTNSLLNTATYPDHYFVALRKAITKLTDKQIKVVQLWLAGKTQVEIAKELGITQGAISLAWHGVNGYGGIIKKLRRLIEKEVELK